MPNRSYVPKFDPPSHYDHVLAHPSTTALTGWWALVGVLVILDAFTQITFSSVTVQQLPAILTLLIGVTVGVGGALALWGTITKHSKISTAWTAQTVGFVLAGAGWTAYAIAVSVGRPEAVLSWGQGVAYAMMSALCIVAVRRAERRKRAEMRHFGMEA